MPMIMHRYDDKYIVTDRNDIGRLERFVMTVFEHLADMNPVANFA